MNPAVRPKGKFPKWVILSLFLAYFAPALELGDASGEYDPAGALVVGWLRDVLPDPGRDWASGLFIAGVFLVYFGIIYGFVRLVVSLVNQARRGVARQPGEGEPNQSQEPTSQTQERMRKMPKERSP
jgi:hypothetical protein